jgi:AraC family transcriptional regulator
MPDTQSLETPEKLRLDFRGRAIRPDTHVGLQFRGLGLEYARVTSAAEYDFDWRGSQHYLALHDIVMEAGELNVEGLSTIPGGDIRNKMTYAPPDRSLAGWSRTTGRQNSFTVLRFDRELITEETERTVLDMDPVPLIYFDDPGLLATMRKLEAIVADGHEHPDIYVETLALLAALELARLQTQRPQTDNRVGRLSGAQETLLRDYIEAHLASDISLDDLAQIARLSRFHLARRFKTTFGTSPHRYLTEVRIGRAKEMLKGTTLQVGEIAKATGFSSAGLLIRAFRSVEGTTPLAYRRR